MLFDHSIVGSHDLVTAPPYDVITDAERRHLLDASPFNVVRLVLGPLEPNDAEATDQYRQSARTLDMWRARGALASTDEPAYFPYEMRFAMHGRPRTIRGLVCAVELEDRGGSIVPHEQTMPGPVEDRLRLMRAVRSNLSCIHVLHPGPNEPLARFLDEASGAEPVALTTDEAGVEHRLWLSPPDPRVATWLAPTTLMIADGHHRYSMALRYRDEMRATLGPGPWDRVMMLVVDSATQEPPVLPFHRILGRGPIRTGGRRVRDLGEVLETVDDEHLVYGTVTNEDGRLVHRVVRLAGAPPTVCALHEQVIRGVDADLRYTPDAVEAEEAVRTGEGVGAYLLPSTDAARIRDVIDRGERLPQKSTYFWPKPRTGLVIRSLELDARDR